DGTKIDREAHASLDVTVRATSADGSTADKAFTIAINDVNEFAVSTPVDNNAAANAVAENAAVGTLVGVTAFASDADATTNTVSYSLTDNAGGAFQIDASSGVITVLDGTKIDRARRASDLVTVRATSADGSTADKAFTIAINDVNEFAVSTPVDNNAAANAVAENAAVGTLVGVTAFASDADATTNTVSYSLTDNAGGAFQIDASSGVITVLDGTKIDRARRASDLVTVRATSADGSTADKAFTIAINDVNEFAVSTPVDNNAAANAVAENAAVGTLVGVTAFASDADATTNTVSYSLTDNAGGAFQIDASSGVITVLDGTKIDRARRASDLVTVRATSADGSTADKAFTIAINDVNEFAVSTPVDNNAAANAVAENAAVGTLVGVTAFASDADATTNTVSYSLTDNAGGAFQIDASSGVITVLDGTKIDRARRASDLVTVRATSADGSTADKAFTIAINDVNEFAVSTPVDNNAAANAVAENAAVGTLVGVTAFASDADATTNTVSYSLTDNAGGAFQIDASSGVITVLDGTKIDREAHASLGVTVRATSADGSTADKAFTIAINDVNEFAVSTPVDNNAAANAVAENAAVGTLVGVTAFASDADATLHAALPILTDNAGGAFQIDASSGVITVLDGTKIDREAHA